MRPKYQRIDLWGVYLQIICEKSILQTVCKLFANRELFAEHWTEKKTISTCRAKARATARAKATMKNHPFKDNCVSALVSTKFCGLGCP